MLVYDCENELFLNVDFLDIYTKFHSKLSLHTYLKFMILHLQI